MAFRCGKGDHVRPWSQAGGTVIVEGATGVDGARGVGDADDKLVPIPGRHISGSKLAAGGGAVAEIEILLVDGPLRCVVVGQDAKRLKGDARIAIDAVGRGVDDPQLSP